MSSKAEIDGMNVTGTLVDGGNRSNNSKQSLPNLLKNGSRMEQSAMGTERDSKIHDGKDVGDGGSTAFGTIVKDGHGTIVSIPDQPDTPG